MNEQDIKYPETRSDRIAYIRSSFRDIIGVIGSIPDGTETPNAHGIHRLKEIARTNAEQAEMWAVKAAHK